MLTKVFLVLSADRLSQLQQLIWIKNTLAMSSHFYLSLSYFSIWLPFSFSHSPLPLDRNAFQTIASSLFLTVQPDHSLAESEFLWCLLLRHCAWISITIYESTLFRRFYPQHCRWYRRLFWILFNFGCLIHVLRLTPLMVAHLNWPASSKAQVCMPPKRTRVAQVRALCSTVFVCLTSRLFQSSSQPFSKYETSKLVFILLIKRLTALNITRNYYSHL